ncbi:MAG: hypothetical protein LH654_04940 [Thermoleophilia bacterium]|nr:hypothetical protein [Thermoleophilia bacterium]
MAPLPTALMVWFFPDKVFWWNYLLLVPALVQAFLFLPLWHRCPYGLDAMRVKLVYTWAHLFAFTDTFVGRPLAWSPTGNQRGGSSGRLRLAKFLLVGWPVAVFAAVVAGSIAQMASITDVNYRPPLIASCVYALTAVLVLRPLRFTRYTAAATRTPAGDGTRIAEPLFGLPTAFASQAGGNVDLGSG